MKGRRKAKCPSTTCRTTLTGGALAEAMVTAKARRLAALGVVDHDDDVATEEAAAVEGAADEVGNSPLPAHLNSFLDSVAVNCENMVKKLSMAVCAENGKLVTKLQDVVNTFSVRLDAVETKCALQLGELTALRADLSSRANPGPAPPSSAPVSTPPTYAAVSSARPPPSIPLLPATFPPLPTARQTRAEVRDARDQAAMDNSIVMNKEACAAETKLAAEAKATILESGWITVERKRSPASRDRVTSMYKWKGSAENCTPLYFGSVRRGRDIGSLRRAINDILGGYFVSGLNFFGGDKLELLVFDEDVNLVVNAVVANCGFVLLDDFRPTDGVNGRELCLERWRREALRSMSPPAVCEFYKRALISLERDMKGAAVLRKHLTIDKKWDSDGISVDAGSTRAPKLLKRTHVLFSESTETTPPATKGVGSPSPSASTHSVTSTPKTDKSSSGGRAPPTLSPSQQ